MTPTRLKWCLAALVTAASAFIVATSFNPIPHSGGDNAGYVALAHGLLTGSGYSDAFDPQGLPHTKYPPVFPGLLALMMAAGARTWVALKLSAAVPTVLAVLFTVLWAQRRVGALPGAAVALMLGSASGVVYYSQWVLSDPLFLALTMVSLWALSMAAPESADASERTDGDVQKGSVASESEADIHRGWLACAVFSAGLAYFTRSAGLPLVLAILAWLALDRRWKLLGGVGAALGLPMFAWWLRGRGDGVAQYGAEFWMVDPYQPALGTIGIPGLVTRILENLSTYVFQHLPGGVVGNGASGLALIGVTLTVVALAGWVLSTKERVGPAEIFFPLYTGLILVWPAVWGGDRFALPLYPLAFLYAAVAIRVVAAKVPSPGGQLIGVAALLVLLLPAGGNWMDGRQQTQECATSVRANGPWACYGSRVGYFVMAASWIREGLPADAAVLTRKPRHFYALSGRPSRAFPFSELAQAQLDLADEIGARYILLDRWDGLATRYVGGAVRERPGAFCYVRGFGQPNEGGAQLLGILPPSDRARAGASGETAVGISACPSEYFNPGTSVEHYSSSGRIPLLEELDS
jgi:4-amino-4-deoxy-L-arabinose transferase-like glycosyltransferase